MKKFLLVISAVSMLVSCNKAGNNEYIVTGNVKGLEDGKTVVLEVQNEMGQFTPVDTVKVEKGVFVIKGSATEPKMHLIQIEKVDGKIAFILENGDINMEINKDSVGLAKVSGTYNNEELTTFKETGMKIQKRMMKFQNDNMAKMNQAQQSQDTVVMNSLRKEYSKFQEEFAKQTDDYVQSHPKAFISALLIEGMFNTMEPDQAKITKYYNNLDASLKTTSTGKKIKTKLDKLSNPIAPPPPPAADQASTPAAGDSKWRTDFSAPNPQGKVISLKDCLGKVTIVDFWASWCGPCRAENPNVVALYNEFHSKGLNIVGVSLDKDATKWKEAIAKDKLSWYQVSNLKHWSEPIALQYKVESIPATFILDAKGKIVAQNLRGEQLRAKIIELLKK